MAVSLPSFEARGSDLADTLLAIEAQIRRFSVETWSSANGAGYESVYNGQGVGEHDRPSLNGVEGQMTQNQMNNLISALNSIHAAIVAASAALAIAAEFSPSVTDGS